MASQAEPAAHASMVSSLLRFCRTGACIAMLEPWGISGVCNGGEGGGAEEVVETTMLYTTASA